MMKQIVNRWFNDVCRTVLDTREGRFRITVCNKKVDADVVADKQCIETDEEQTSNASHTIWLLLIDQAVEDMEPAEK